MRRFTFEFLDGEKVTYEARTLEEAMEKRYQDHGNRPWTLVVSDGKVRD